MHSSFSHFPTAFLETPIQLANCFWGISAAQERSKKEISGRLQDVAVKKIDEQTDALVGIIGDHQID